MSDECITRNSLVVFNYLPYRPTGFGSCFIGGDNDELRACSIPVTECGISLKGLPRNNETTDLFRVASEEGLPEILSVEDAYSAALSEELPNMPPQFFLFRLFRRDPSTCFELAKLFVADARTAVEMFRKKGMGK